MPPTADLYPPDTGGVPPIPVFYDDYGHFYLAGRKLPEEICATLTGPNMRGVLRRKYFNLAEGQVMLFEN